MHFGRCASGECKGWRISRFYLRFRSLAKQTSLIASTRASRVSRDEANDWKQASVRYHGNGEELKDKWSDISPTFTVSPSFAQRKRDVWGRSENGAVLRSSNLVAGSSRFPIWRRKTRRPWGRGWWSSSPKVAVLTWTPVDMHRPSITLELTNRSLLFYRKFWFALHLS